jgi:LysM repeat protein
MEKQNELTKVFALSENDLEEVTGGTEKTHEVYIVQPGDSLHSIAQALGITTAELALLNRDVIIKTAQQHGYHFINPVQYANYIFEGEELLLP